MPRVPRPDDMARASLQPASNPAQINIGVASRIGESGRAMGNAIASIGHAFGEVADRIGIAKDAQNADNAKLAWLKGDHGIQQDIMQKAGEDGALWQEAPKRYEAMNADIAAKYPISDPQRRRSFEMWREQQTFNRSTDAARTYQGAQHKLFLKSFEQDLAGVEDRISKGDIDPATFGEYYNALQSKLAGMNRTVLHEADVQAKTRELQARLTMSLNRYVEPGERARFWDTVGKGRYEVEAPGGAGGGGLFPVGGSMAGKTWADVPSAGKSPNSRDFGYDVRRTETGGFRNHAGLDIPGMPGDPVMAVGDGKVVRMGMDQNGYGPFVDIQYADGTIHRKAHLGNVDKGGTVSPFAAGLKEGATVKAGQTIGYLGYSGNAGKDFPHVHYEVFKSRADYDRAGGKPSRHGLDARIDPREWARQRQSTATDGIKTDLTAYAPQRGGDTMQGGYAAAKPGPDGKAEVRTLEDVATGKAKYVTLAGDPSLYGKSYIIPRITYIDKTGKSQVLENVRAVVHDTGSAFKGKPEGRFDVAVARDVDEQTRNANHAAWKQAGIQFVPERAGNAEVPPVSERGRTRVVGVQQRDSAIKSDAIVPPPGIQLGPPTAGNDNPPALLDLGPEGDKIAKVAADQPDTPLSQVLSGEEIAALAEKHEAFRALGDRDDDITVGEVGKLVETVQEAPVRVAQAGGRDADTAVLGIPRGRLAPGQEFTVRTPKGEFKVPSEWINAIPDKLRQEYARRAREDLRLYERQLRTTADEMMKSQEAHVAAHGRDAPDYDVRAVQAAYARDPARIAAHGRRIRMAKTVFDTLGEAANLPDDEVVSRLERLKPKAGSKAFAEVADIYDKAEEKVAELLKQREKDPAGAVEGSKLVTRARESMVGGRPQSHLDQIVLIDARLKAQAALEIDETSRRPLPEQEAKALGARIRGLDPVAITGAIGPGATPSSALDSINATHAYIKKQYGERYSGAILAQAIEAAVRDKEKSKAFGVALQAMEDSGMVSPTTLARIRARDALNSQEKALPVKPPDKSSGIWEQMNQISRRIGATMPAISPDNPFPTSQEIFEMTGPPVSPPKRAIEWLRDNPDLAVEFERKYGLKPGEAVRYLAR